MRLRGTKIILENKSAKDENVVINDIKISQRLKNKSYLGIEKDITKSEKIKVKLLNKMFKVCSYKSSYKSDNPRVAYVPASRYKSR